MIDVLEYAAGLGVDVGWVLLAIAVFAVFGVGRLARLITYDEFPPAVWWRVRWAAITNDGPWEKLFTCYWCLTPWIMLVTLGLLIFSWEIPWLAIVWLVFYGWLALSYITSMIVNRDERE